MDQQQIPQQELQRPKRENQGGGNLTLFLGFSAYVGAIIIMVIALVIYILSAAFSYGSNFGASDINNWFSPSLTQLITFIASLVLVAPAVIFGLQKKRGISFQDRFNLHNPGPAAILLCLFLIGPLAQLAINGLQMLWQAAFPALFEAAERQQGASSLLFGDSVWIVLFVIAVTPAITEELLFRGMVLGEYAQRMKRNKAIALSALVFSLMHISFFSLPYTFLLGLILAWLFYQTHSIIPGMVLHFSFNASAVLLEMVVPKSFTDKYINNLIPGTIAVNGLLFLIIGGAAVVGLLALLRKLSAEARKTPIKQLYITKTHKWAFVTVVSVLGAFAAIILLAILLVASVSPWL